MLPLRQQGIPEQLTGCAQWVLWKVVERDGCKTKLPYQINGSLAKSNDPETWATFEACVKRYATSNGWDGIGFVFSVDDPYCGIDLDGCRDPQTGIVAEWARKIILEFASYAEVSPSASGVKIWMRGSWPYTGNKHELTDLPVVGGKRPAIEVYDRLRYFAVTGAVLKDQKQIGDRQQQLDALRKMYWPDEPASPPAATAHTDFRSASSIYERAKKYLEKMPVAITGQNGHGTTYSATCRLVIGFGLSDEDAYSLLCEWNTGCQPPWSERELRHKINCAMREPGERGYLRNVSPSHWDRIPLPVYKQQPQKNENPPDVTTLKDAATKYLEKISNGDDGLIELGFPELDYAIGGGVASSEFVLVCARPSHGKSAAALQMVHHWTAGGMPCLFISEEMSSLMLGQRTVQFAADVPREHWGVRMAVVQEQLERHFSQRSPCLVVERCLTADAAAEEIRRAKKNNDIKCAVVDYAQLLGSAGKDRYQQTTNTSVCLRQVASETQIVLVALCQLNRAIETRTVFVPKMSDIRETGQFEQDADVIIFAVWPHRIDHQLDPNEYQFFVCKNRNRPINDPVVKCRFEPSRQRFLESKPFMGAEHYFPATERDF